MLRIIVKAFAALLLLQWTAGSLVLAADLVTADELQRWHVEKARGGPTFSGSPAWHAHMQFVETGLRKRGVVDLTREPITYTRWFASDAPAAKDRALKIDTELIPVAGYWAYSGSTGAAGVTAPMLYYERETPVESLRDRIVVFDVGTIPKSMRSTFDAGHVYATDDAVSRGDKIASDQWFQEIGRASCRERV